MGGGGGASNLSKKRKMISKDKEEDEKAEKFFALIKDARELRDPLLLCTQERRHERELTTKMGQDDRRSKAPIWKPTFKMEDFVVGGSDDSRDRTKEDGSSRMEKSDEGCCANGGVDIDLNISL
ncbi:hypothetical protein Droror1_Dr00023171 [Drosera rotundifolia]